MDSAKSHPPIPTNPYDVTVEWLSTVLNMEINENSLSVEGNISNGIGLFSTLLRVEFIGKCKDGNVKKHNYVIKFLPLKGMEREFVIQEKLHCAELSFYKILAPDLLQEMPALEEYLCHFMYGNIREENKAKNIEAASVLILEDLQNDGYIAKPFDSHQLSTEEINLSLDFLAKFHVASSLLELRKKRKLNEIYFFSAWYAYTPNSKEDKSLFVHALLKAGFEHSKNLINEYISKINPSDKEIGQEIISKMLEALAPHAEYIFKIFLEASQKNPCLIHGDMWQNNMLVSSEESKPSIKVVDWQIMGYSDSAYDLALLLFTSMAPNFDLEKMEHLAKIYYDLHEKLFWEKMKERGVNISMIKPRRSWKEFWQTFRTFGFTFVFIIYLTGAESMIIFPENLKKIFASFHFLHFNSGLTEFLLSVASRDTNMYVNLSKIKHK